MHFYQKVRWIVKKYTIVLHGTVKMALELSNAMTFHHFDLSPMVVCAKRSGTIACFSCNWVVIFFVNRLLLLCCCCCCCCCCCSVQYDDDDENEMMMGQRQQPAAAKKTALLLLVVVIYVYSLLSLGISEKSTYFISNMKTAVFIWFLKVPEKK